VPPKKRIDLPDHVRAAVLSDVALSHQQAEAADENSKIRIFLATEQGLDTYELAEELGVSQSVISNWRRKGKELYELRRKGQGPDRESAGDQSAGQDPLRSAEREPVG
jgi:transcriptional antiterminator